MLSYLDTLHSVSKIHCKHMFVAVMKQVRWAMKASYSAEKFKTSMKTKNRSPQ